MYKHRLVLLAALFIFSGGALLAGDTLYASAVRSYESGRYEESLETWEALVASGKEAATLYYNMGNAAYRSNNIGKAILYYEKAIQLNPGYPDAVHNLGFVSRYKVDVFDEVPTFFLSNWAQKIVRALPEKAWSLLSLALLILCMSSVLIYLFTRGPGLKKAGFYTALLALIFFAFTLSAAIRSHQNIVRPHSGIILDPSVVIRSTPSETGTELFVLHEGTRIELKEGLGEWYNIRIVDGREGWIPAGALGVI